VFAAGGRQHFAKIKNNPNPLAGLDAHVDMNTLNLLPQAMSPRMPLAAIMGYGAPELSTFSALKPKRNPQLVLSSAARDLEPRSAKSSRNPAFSSRLHHARH